MRIFFFFFFCLSVEPASNLTTVSSVRRKGSMGGWVQGAPYDFCSAFFPPGLAQYCMARAAAVARLLAIPPPPAKQTSWRRPLPYHMYCSKSAWERLCSPDDLFVSFYLCYCIYAYSPLTEVGHVGGRYTPTP